MLTYSRCRYLHKLFPLVCIAVGLLFTANLEGGKNKKKPALELHETPPLPEIDTRNLVWPDPPDIPRIRWLEQYRGEPKPTQPMALKPKKRRAG